MPINNPYIEKVNNHPYIITDTQIASQNKWKWNKFFGNGNEIILEIWTGLGNFFSSQVAQNPDKNYIWMEIKFKRCYVTAEKSLKKWGKNFVIIKDFAQKIDEIFWNEEIFQTYIFFPDPWGRKERQKKHRLMQKEFLTSLYNKTKLWWRVIFKTDHRWYFDDTLKILNELNLWKQERKTYHYERDCEEFSTKEITEFEAIFREHRLEICYVELIKK